MNNRPLQSNFSRGLLNFSEEINKEDNSLKARLNFNHYTDVIKKKTEKYPFATLDGNFTKFIWIIN